MTGSAPSLPGTRRRTPAAREPGGSDGPGAWSYPERPPGCHPPRGSRHGTGGRAVCGSWGRTRRLWDGGGADAEPSGSPPGARGCAAVCGPRQASVRRWWSQIWGRRSSSLPIRSVSSPLRTVFPPTHVSAAPPPSSAAHQLTAARKRGWDAHGCRARARNPFSY